MITSLVRVLRRHYIVSSAVACCVVAALVAGGLSLHRSSPPADDQSSGFGVGTDTDTGAKIKAGKLVCGKPILDSPYDYTGPAGPYSSGTPGLPTFGKLGSDFPKNTAGVVIPAGKKSYFSYELRPNTVYYLEPGTHIGSFMADQNDSFVGGLSHGTPAVLTGNYSGLSWGIDSNSSNGDQPGVTIEYLTIEKYQPVGEAAAVNQESNTAWTLQYNTITMNAPGAGVILGTNNVLRDNCLTLNGQYGFQSVVNGSWGEDSLTGGPYNVTVEGNEISYNDTCDFEGLLDNSAIGWAKHNPVPPRYRNPHCGTVQPDGNEGGFKLWQTNGVTIKGNNIHDNWGPGAWVDTDNANTTITGNTFINNDGGAIIEEISYNFAITNNYMANNGWAGGLANPGFPTPAIYISGSGSDTTFGGVPACPKKACPDQPSYPAQSVVSGNTLINNGGNIFLWQDSNRFCSDGFDGICTLVNGGFSGPFTTKQCKANIPSASIDMATYVGKRTGSPLQDWWDGCIWRTANVRISHNVIDFNPAEIAHCNQSDWPACGAGGTFSQYGSTNPYVSANIPTQLTFYQNNSWSDNIYNGPSTFFVWNQGSNDNPVSWADWTKHTSGGDKCSSPGERSSGGCKGPFGQDAGSTYNATPAS